MDETGSGLASAAATEEVAEAAATEMAEATAEEVAEAAAEEMAEAAATVDAARLAELLREFVQLHAGMRQRDPDWYKSMGVTVGGSELAAVMGANPYSTFFDVVASKVAALGGGGVAWAGGGEACWWGTLFEDVIAAYVEVDLGSPVQGAEICVQAIPGHRNSPDGYVVVKLDTRGARPALWTTDMDPRCPTQPRVALLEFKCPLTRKPKGDVPPQYRPQVWSGLAVSPVAQLGLFVDAVFRKCGLLDLGDSPDYDTAYHSRDLAGPRPADWAYPVAWGLVFVYAPRLEAPRHVRLGWRGPEWAPGDPTSEEPDADAAQAAWAIHSAYFGLRLKPALGCRDVADLGDMERGLFGRALGLVNRGRFPTAQTLPCFADGRGAALRSGRELGAVFERARRAAPPHHWLFGALPWKLLEVDYVPVARRPGFLAEVLPAIQAVHQMAAEALASGEPARYLAAKRSALARPPAPPCDDAALQELFDSIA